MKLYGGCSMSTREKANVAARSVRNLLFSATSLVSIGWAGVAVAQTAPAADADDAGVEELVVTARSRAERLIDVPDAITAFSAEHIARAGVNELNDFVRLTPGVALVEASQSPGIALINIRGVGQQYQGEAPVAVVIDGVQVISVSAINQGLVDVERIEVLRGPQGALYGRNAIGGAINIVTAEPTDEFEGGVTVGYANGEDEMIEGVLSGPLGSDRLLFRVAGHYNDFDGTITNPITDTETNALMNSYGRLRLLARPTDNLTLDFRASHDTTENAGYNGSILATGDTDDFSLPPMSAREGWGRLEVDELSFKASLDTSLGELSATTGYVQSEDSSSYDLDLSPADVLELNLQRTSIEALSQELRLTSNDDGPLRYTAGLFYVATERDRFTDVEVVPFAMNLFADATDDNSAWAAFAQVNYDITDRLELTLAGRYDEDEREQTNNLVPDSDPDRVVSHTFTMFQPKLSLAYTLAPDVTLYATAAQGFRSGGFNTPGPVFDRIYDSEETTNYELGLKSYLFDGRLLLNVAAYSILYENQQVQLLDLGTGQQGMVNIPETESVGLEVEFSARLSSAFTLTGGVGYLDSEIKDFPALAIVEGNRPPFSPEFTYNLALDYTQPVSDNWDLLLRAAVTGQSGMYYEYYSRETNGALPYYLDSQPAYALVDLRASLRSDAWTLTAFLDNAFDEEYYSDASSRIITSFAEVGVRGRTQRYGVQLGYRF